MNRIIRLYAVTLAGLIVGSPAFGTVRIITSTTDLASIAQLIGGNKVKVESITNGKANPHFVEVLPSYMVKVVRADVYLKVGLGLDMWADQIIDGSRNSKLLVVDCSQRITPLEKPTGRVDASMGDVHPSGNPHYWLDPDNGVPIAESITEALKKADPENSEHYDRGLLDFKSALETKKHGWQELQKILHGKEIVTYHNSWPYFCQAFGIEVVGFIEPKPGIEPTPHQTAKIIEIIRSRKIKVIGKEPYYPNRTPQNIARETSAKVVDLPTSVGGVDAARDYFSLFDALLRTLISATKE